MSKVEVEPAVAPRGGGGGHGGGGGGGGGASYSITPWCTPTDFDTIVMGGSPRAPSVEFSRCTPKVKKLTFVTNV